MLIQIRRKSFRLNSVTAAGLCKLPSLHAHVLTSSLTPFPHCSVSPAPFTTQTRDTTSYLRNVLCPESGSRKTTKRPDAKAKSLLNYKFTCVLHPSDTAGGGEKIRSCSREGRTLGIEQGEIWGSQDWCTSGLGEPGGHLRAIATDCSPLLPIKHSQNLPANF